MTNKKIIENIIFNARWILVLFYFKLYWTLIKLLYYFWIGNVSIELVMQTLEDIDLIMIANLVKMVLTGSYNSFISKEHGFKNENNSSGQLKIKILTSMMSIIAISSLKNSLETHSISWDNILKQLAIFLSFTIAAFVLAKIDYLHVKSELKEHNNIH